MATIQLAPRPEEPATDSPSEKAVPQKPLPAAQASFPAKLVICVFVSLYLLGSIQLLFNLWLANGTEIAWILGMRGVPLGKDVIPIVHVVLGAILGAGVLDLVSFHHYASELDDFQTRHIWGYFFGPIMAAALSIVIYALLRSGLLVFAGGAGSGDSSTTSNFGYLAVGFFSGFGWYDAVQSIQAAIKRFFSSGSKQNEPSPEPKPVDASVSGGSSTAEAVEKAALATTTVVSKP
jgi:hypothetical protein